MKQFIVRLGLIAFLTYGLALILENSISAVIEKFRTRNKVNVAHRKEIIDSDVFILGSSRAWHNVIPSILRDSLNLRVYNLAYDDFGELEILTQIKYLVSEGARPLLVLVQIDETFGSIDKSIIARQEFLPLYSVFNQNSDLKVFFESCPDQSKYRFPLYRYTKYRDLSWRGMLKLPFIYSEGLLNQGYKPYPVGKFVESYDKRNGYSEMPVTRSERVDRLIEFCEIESIELIFFTSPVFNLENDLLIKFFKVNYGNYIDQSSLLTERSDFIDFNHVNEVGAKKQTADLAHQVRKLRVK